MIKKVLLAISFYKCPFQQGTWFWVWNLMRVTLQNLTCSSSRYAAYCLLLACRVKQWLCDWNKLSKLTPQTVAGIRYCNLRPTWRPRLFGAHSGLQDMPGIWLKLSSLLTSNFHTTWIQLGIARETNELICQWRSGSDNLMINAPISRSNDAPLFNYMFTCYL